MKTEILENAEKDITQRGDHGEEKENMVSLRGFNLSYKEKLENLKTIKNIDNNKKIIKLVLEDVDLDPKVIMEHVVNMLKEKTTLYTVVEINKQKYKVKYNEVTPDDYILFPENVSNIANCKYAYIGILKVAKYTKKCTFNEKSFQAWQDVPMEF
ncbi:Uncharacterized protein PCOAH_00038980 [Plasmodium coatneyi]|uniref:Uncharacterized protein n=1 Tax=Plasmodium coatneyi TaxID=208452 RepID=A0A1B1E385_9APIC|nr:Uncharacterized protein PCOAH_00038980 [Plasmodium coatneyi]ANQ09417.1 Uncharacterized protein PCOAH_00038980 [Plasmodium coatneyi]